jgi:hypothetical protein
VTAPADEEVVLEEVDGSPLLVVDGPLPPVPAAVLPVVLLPLLLLLSAVDSSPAPPAPPPSSPLQATHWSALNKNSAPSAIGDDVEKIPR